MFRLTKPLFGLVLLAAVLLLTQPVFTQSALPYQDASLPVEARVDDLLARMSLAEKIGQMTLVEKNSIPPADVDRYYIGGILSGGGGSPSQNTAAAWMDMVHAYQDEALNTPLAIPMIYGVDAVHGHGNLRGATLFPHQIGLGATRNPALLEQIGQVTAQEMIATGIYWNYGPAVSVAQDIRWGRTYESYSEDPAVVSELAVAYLRGMQGDSLADALTVMGTPKHFVGDGGTAFRSSTTGNYILDQGVTDIDEATLRETHLPPYEAAIANGARSIMVSFSSWGGMKMHAQEYLLTDVLKGELGFDGFLVSDWEGINQISVDYYDAVVTSINAGVDMNMVPYTYTGFIDVLTAAVDSGDVPLERIDDAVRRILRVKFEMGLFERPYGNESLLDTVGSDEHRAVARQAVSESLVLLKNAADVLPLDPATATIFVGGDHADNIGLQAGGWTIQWQGMPGAITPGTTLLDGIEQAVSGDSDVFYNRFGNFNQVDASGDPLRADVGIAVIGELPYAEGEGDAVDLSLPDAQLNMINKLRERSEVLIIILVSGRPMIISDELDISDAFVVAWLPGTEGAGVADALFGDQPFGGKLGFTWPRSMEQVPLANALADPLFPFGYGLETES